MRYVYLPADLLHHISDEGLALIAERAHRNKLADDIFEKITAEKTLTDAEVDALDKELDKKCNR